MLVHYELYDNQDKLGAKFFCQLHARVPRYVLQLLFIKKTQKW
jgi:hypothetical protein